MRDQPGRPLSGALRVVERLAGRNGELVLRTDGRHFEVISNGTFLMDTRDGRSERLLATAALAGREPGCSVLIGGLGVGFTLAAALAHPACGAVTVIEIEPAVIRWQRRHLGPVTGAVLDDPRVRLVEADLLGWLAEAPERYDVVCLDVDNGPGWTVTEANRGLYDEAGLRALAGLLAPGGTLAVWAAAPPEAAFEQALARAVGPVRTLAVPVDRGVPDVVLLAARPPT